MNDNLSDYEKYLKQVHLKGKERTLTIVRFSDEETHPKGGRAETALVVWFREVPFGLILSPTNRRTLQAICDPLAGWIGKPITVKAVAVKVGAVTKTPIRIVNTAPSAPRVEPGTGEIIDPTPPPATEPPGARDPDPRSELDEYLGPNPREAEAPAPAPLLLPTSETEFRNWQIANRIGGVTIKGALGCSDREWLKKHPGMTWADVTRQVLAALDGNHAKAGA